MNISLLHPEWDTASSQGAAANQAISKAALLLIMTHGGWREKPVQMTSPGVQARRVVRERI